MNAVFTVLALVVLGVSSPLVRAEERLGDRHWLASPDNRHLLTFIGGNPRCPGAFAIQDLHGVTLFSSRDCPELRDIANYEPEHAVWSPDGQAVALAAGHPKFLLTYVFARSGRGFVFVPVPLLAKGLDNPWILPVAWLKDRTVRVKISGPYAGKAGGYRYEGEAILRVTLDPPKCEKIAERIR